MPNFDPGHDFIGATGLKADTNLRDLVREALFAASSGALDQVTIEDDGSGKAQVKAGGIDTPQLADDAVTGAKIADDAVDTDQIADDAITADQIADDAIPVAAIPDGELTNAKLATRGGLANGTDGLVFEAFSGAATQSVAKNGYRVVALSSQQYDPGNVFDTSTYKYTPGVKGYYDFVGAVKMENIAAGSFMRAVLLVNGSVVKEGSTQKTAVLDDPTSIVAVSRLRLASVTDYVQLAVYHNSTSNRNVLGGSRSYTYLGGGIANSWG